LSDGSPPAPAAPCPLCLERQELCVCAEIAPVANKAFVLILQHPQEQDRDLGTARLALRHFVHGKLAIGLSWPNLAKALGRPADPRRWGVLYLGPADLTKDAGEGGVAVLDRQGKPLAIPAAVLTDLDGIVLLDGSWSQAKALWWRNAWLLKLHRIVLLPPRPSRYGKLRREPRADSVSTLEATAQIMAVLEGKPELANRMLASFEAMLKRYRAAREPAATLTP
jgi:DTW domain-containing protein YfiP